MCKAIQEKVYWWVLFDGDNDDEAMKSRSYTQARFKTMELPGDLYLAALIEERLRLVSSR